MRRFVIVFASLGLLLAACGGAAETLTEQIVENETGGNIENNGDSIVIESDDGEATIEISKTTTVSPSPAPTTPGKRSASRWVARKYRMISRCPSFNRVK